MRKFIYLFIAIISFASCKSVSKMVEKGEYDQAFNYAIKKLTGEKNKKTEYVKALEKAYAKLNANTLKEIDRLNPSAKPENWSRVLDLYRSIEERQDRLDPLLPLVSEDGYKAKFDMTSYRSEIVKAEDNTCEYYYNNAINLIEKSRKTGDRILARQAYDELRKVDDIKLNYKETETYKLRALDLGVTKIKFEVYSQLKDFMSSRIEDHIFDLPVAKLDEFWYDFTFENIGKSPDYIVAIDLESIFFSPERERVNTYAETREVAIEEGNSGTTKDTLKTAVTKVKFETVKANITEVFREKQSELHGKIRIIEVRTNKVVKSLPVNVFYEFNGYSCGYTGDKRALSDETTKKLDNFLEPFPTDLLMSDNLAAAFNDGIIKEVKKYKFY